MLILIISFALNIDHQKMHFQVFIIHIHTYIVIKIIIKNIIFCVYQKYSDRSARAGSVNPDETAPAPDGK